MSPLEKFATAVRVAGFGKVASTYIELSGEAAPDVWDLKNTLLHLGTKLSAQAQEETAVQVGVRALNDVSPGAKTSYETAFTPEFHAVNSLSKSSTKLASHNLEATLAERRLALWTNMKRAAETTTDPQAHLAKIAIQVWSETERSGEKTASSREEREAFAVSFAANYLVDQKIAQLNVPSNVKAKLASLSAEAAMFDLNRVVGATGEHQTETSKLGMSKEALDPRIIGALVGATGGGALGAWDDKENRLRGGVMGALMGAPLGAVGGHVYHEYAAHFAQQANDAAKKLTDANASLQKAIGAAKMLAHSGQGGNALQQLTNHEDAVRQHFLAGNKNLPLGVAQHLSPDDMNALHSALSHLNTRVV